MKTKIKLCGLSRECDIMAANELRPEYIGFVFAPKSRRYVSAEKAARLKGLLDRDITAVGVFVNEAPEVIAGLLDSGVIQLAQLHGTENDAYIMALRAMTGKPVIKAFSIRTEADAARAEQSSADFILLDAGAGTGTVFDWRLIQGVKRPYFLAGGLGPENVAQAIEALGPYGVDVSSGIETNGEKDKQKMAAFMYAARHAERKTAL